MSNSGAHGRIATHSQHAAATALVRHLPAAQSTHLCMLSPCFARFLLQRLVAELKPPTCELSLHTKGGPRWQRERRRRTCRRCLNARCVRDRRARAAWLHKTRGRQHRLIRCRCWSLGVECKRLPVSVRQGTSAQMTQNSYTFCTIAQHSFARTEHVASVAQTLSSGLSAKGTCRPCSGTSWSRTAEAAPWFLNCGLLTL